MQLQLVYFRDDGTRKNFPINKDSCVIGRGDSCDLQIPLASISREHCRLTIEDDQVHIMDLGSSNGTFRNSHRIEASETFEPGDRLSLGRITLTLQIDGQPSEIEPPLLEAPTQAHQAKPATPDPAPAHPDPDDSDADIDDLIARASSAANDESSVFDFDLDLDDD